MEISVTWCLFGILQTMNLKNHLFTAESKCKLFSENYRYISIFTWGQLLPLKKLAFTLNYLRFQSSPFSWLIFPLVNVANF